MEATKMIRFQMPIKPISTNDIWYRTGKAHITQKYLDFQEDFFKLAPRGHRMITGLCELDIKIYLQKRWLLCDTDNFLKGLLDCIVKAGYLENDRFIKKITIEKFPDIKDHLEIKIKELN